MLRSSPCLCLEVELLRIGVHYDVVRRLFAVVDARVGDYVSGVVVGAFLLHLYDPVRRYVLGEELGSPLRGELRDRAHGESEAVRVAQPRVDPRLGVFVQLLVGNLPRRQHHLPVLAANEVTVYVGVLEVVVRSDELYLSVDSRQRPVVPEAYVVYRLLVLRHQVRRGEGVHGVWLLRDVAQAEAGARELYAADDVRLLAGKLVGPDRQALHRRGPGRTKQEGHHGPQGKPTHEQADAPHVRVHQNENARRGGYDREDGQGRPAGV